MIDSVGFLQIIIEIMEFPWKSWDYHRNLMEIIDFTRTSMILNGILRINIKKDVAHTKRPILGAKIR